MSSTTAFFAGGGPNGNPTSALTVAGSSVNTALTGTGNDVQFYNSSTVVIHVAFGAVGVVATAAVVGTPGNGIPIPAGAVMVLQIPANATNWAANGASGTIFATQGEGI